MEDDFETSPQLYLRKVCGVYRIFVCCFVLFTLSIYLTEKMDSLYVKAFGKLKNI
jgi:hypothetical protein